MEVARDLRECWVLKTFWAASAGAATIALPTVVLSAEANGYGSTFYIYLLHYALYVTIAGLAFKYPHEASTSVPELVGFGGMDDAAPKGSKERVHQGFMTVVWRDRMLRLLAVFAPVHILKSTLLINFYIVLALGHWLLSFFFVAGKTVPRGSIA
jgi:hypothetical protein